jgi:hypothetical protein
MAWGSLNTLGSAQIKTSGTNNLKITTSAAAQVGNIIIVCVAGDNIGAADTDSGTEHSISDSVGNTYHKARERVNGSPGAAAGATASIFYAKVTTELPSGGTITLTTSSAITAKAMTAWEFSLTGAVTLAAGATGSPEEATTSPSATIGSLASAEYLWVACIAVEGPSGDTYTKDADYTAMSRNGTTGSSAVSNMTVNGEFRIFTGTTDTDAPTLGTARDLAHVYAALKEITIYYKSAAVTESSAMVIGKRQKRTSAITESSGLTLNKKQRRSIAVTETSSLTIIKKQSRLVSIVESSVIAASLKRLYLIVANIVSSNLLSILKKQSRSVAVQETSALQTIKAQRRQVIITEASSVTIGKRQRRLAQITSAAQVTFNYLKTLKLAFSISVAPIIAAAKKQSRAFMIVESSIVTFTKQVITGGGQLYHLAFDITSAIVVAARKKQFRSILVTTTTMLAIRKAQRRTVSLLATASISVQKLQRRQVYVAAVTVVAYVLQALTTLAVNLHLIGQRMGLKLVGSEMRLALRIEKQEQ